jgi:hypothetical protein
MEKAPGVELEHMWPSMQIKDRFAVVKAIAAYQKAWTSVSFKKFGSLYYASDLEGQFHEEQVCSDGYRVEIPDNEFAIGPTVAREWIDDGRASMDLYRGPCKLTSSN